MLMQPRKEQETEKRVRWKKRERGKRRNASPYMAGVLLSILANREREISQWKLRSVALSEARFFFFIAWLARK